MKLRTIWATVTVAEEGLTAFKVTKTDDRINPTALAVGDEPLITNGIGYTQVFDDHKPSPRFDLFFRREGSKDLDIGDKIVVLCQDNEGELIYLNWTNEAEYRRCQAQIDQRLGKKKAVQVQKPTQPTKDTNIYRLFHDNQSFTGKIGDIVRALYKYDRQSQASGWPCDCVWSIHDGRGFVKCDAPAHPGTNQFLEPKPEAAVSAVAA